MGLSGTKLAQKCDRPHISKDKGCIATSHVRTRGEEKMLMVTWSDAPSEITDAQAVSRRGSIGTRLCHVGVPCNLDLGRAHKKMNAPVCI
jgi:hypothetical protein